jgi:hypothetical protein
VIRLEYPSSADEDRQINWCGFNVLANERARIRQLPCNLRKRWLHPLDNPEQAFSTQVVDQIDGISDGHRRIDISVEIVNRGQSSLDLARRRLGHALQALTMKIESDLSHNPNLQEGDNSLSRTFPKKSKHCGPVVSYRLIGGPPSDLPNSSAPPRGRACLL